MFRPVSSVLPRSMVASRSTNASKSEAKVDFKPRRQTTMRQTIPFLDAAGCVRPRTLRNALAHILPVRRGREAFGFATSPRLRPEPHSAPRSPQSPRTRGRPCAMAPLANRWPLDRAVLDWSSADGIREVVGSSPFCVASLGVCIAIMNLPRWQNLGDRVVFACTVKNIAARFVPRN